MSTGKLGAVGHGRKMLAHYLEPINGFLNDADLGVTELCINRPGEIWVECRKGWVRYNAPELTLDACMQICKLIASSNGASLIDGPPVLSATLPTKERVQIVIPPACSEGTVSITIRKPSLLDFSLDELEQQGAFEGIQDATDDLMPFEHELLRLKKEGQFKEFMKLAVTSHRNIIIGGATGSGKTTFTKSLIRHIDRSERVITIEDAHELFLSDHPNKVHLFYKKVDGSTFTSQDALASCMRMKPDRILLAELRGAETLDYIDSLNTGHPGSISTIHANSAKDVFSRLTSLILRGSGGASLDEKYIYDMCLRTIDVVMFYERKKLKEIYYDPYAKRSNMG